MADERFKALATDPRYRLPSRRQAQTAVDPRFQRLFTDEGFQKKSSVDRYGRKTKSDSGAKELRRRFRLDEEVRPVKAKPAKVDEKAIPDGSVEDFSENEEEEHGEVRMRDPAREGFSGSSSEEESTSEEESEGEDELAEETAGNEQTEQVPLGEVSRRIAAVNLDWDNIRATDIMAVAQSFAPSGGRIKNVKVYPSDFGRQRMEKEEVEGPPREIFASATQRRDLDEESDEDHEDKDDDEEDEMIKERLLRDQADGGEEFDTAKLRQYQLERLRYYYAVITCDGEATAQTLYDSMDGREYLTTANFFDLRFIPDETSFDDDEPRDECSKLPEGYKPNDFQTEALTHSKVRLTWDDDDTTRKEVQKRAFSRAEIDENDLQAYIGSESSDADSIASRKSAVADRRAKKRETERANTRAVLGLRDAPAKGGKSKADEPVGDVQITFSAGLTANQNGKGVFENEPQDEESTRARYIRKERERKQKRKDKMKVARTDEEDGLPEKQEAQKSFETDVVGGDDPFDDPFFNDPTTATATEKAARKLDRRNKREAREAEEQAAAARRAELELLMADDNGDAVRHFNMREVEKAVKDARRKKGKKASRKANSNAAAGTDDFKLEAADPRFKALFESHEFAIDPTNPKFKGTEGMKALLEEGRKKRKKGHDDSRETQERPEKSAKRNRGATDDNSRGEDLKGLVARLKTKPRA